MTGAPLIASWVALGAFWMLLLIGIYFGEIGGTGAITSAILWLVGYFGLPRIAGGLFVTPYTAVLDVVLVMIVFKGDVRLS